MNSHQENTPSRVNKAWLTEVVRNEVFYGAAITSAPISCLLKTDTISPDYLVTSFKQRCCLYGKGDIFLQGVEDILRNLTLRQGISNKELFTSVQMALHSKYADLCAQGEFLFSKALVRDSDPRSLDALLIVFEIAKPKAYYFTLIFPNDPIFGENTQQNSNLTKVAPAALVSSTYRTYKQTEAIMNDAKSTVSAHSSETVSNWRPVISSHWAKKIINDNRIFLGAQEAIHFYNLGHIAYSKFEVRSIKNRGGSWSSTMDAFVKSVVDYLVDGVASSRLSKSVVDICQTIHKMYAPEVRALSLVTHPVLRCIGPDFLDGEETEFAGFFLFVEDPKQPKRYSCLLVRMDDPAFQSKVEVVTKSQHASREYAHQQVVGYLVSDGEVSTLNVLGSVPVIQKGVLHPASGGTVDLAKQKELDLLPKPVPKKTYPRYPSLGYTPPSKEYAANSAESLSLFNANKVLPK